MSASDAIASLGASITSPAKLGFIGYVVLAFGDRIKTSKWEFLVVAMFFFLQVGHDDYLRIRLNKLAERSSKRN